MKKNLLILSVLLTSFAIVAKNDLMHVEQGGIVAEGKLYGASKASIPSSQVFNFEFTNEGSLISNFSIKQKGKELIPEEIKESISSLGLSKDGQIRAGGINLKDGISISFDVKQNGKTQQKTYQIKASNEYGTAYLVFKNGNLELIKSSLFNTKTSSGLPLSNNKGITITPIE